MITSSKKKKLSNRHSPCHNGYLTTFAPEMETLLAVKGQQLLHSMDKMDFISNNDAIAWGNCKDQR